MDRLSGRNTKKPTGRIGRAPEATDGAIKRAKSLTDREFRALLQIPQRSSKKLKGERTNAPTQAQRHVSASAKKAGVAKPKNIDPHSQTAGPILLGPAAAAAAATRRRSQASVPPTDAKEPISNSPLDSPSTPKPPAKSGRAGSRKSKANQSKKPEVHRSLSVGHAPKTSVSSLEENKKSWKEIDPKDQLHAFISKKAREKLEREAAAKQALNAPPSEKVDVPKQVLSPRPEKTVATPPATPMTQLVLSESLLNPPPQIVKSPDVSPINSGRSAQDSLNTSGTFVPPKVSYKDQDDWKGPNRRASLKPKQESEQEELKRILPLLEEYCPIFTYMQSEHPYVKWRNPNELEAYAKDINSHLRDEMKKRGKGNDEITAENWQPVCLILQEDDYPGASKFTNYFKPYLMRAGCFDGEPDPSLWRVLYELKTNKATTGLLREFGSVIKDLDEVPNLLKDEFHTNVYRHILEGYLCKKWYHLLVFIKNKYPDEVWEKPEDLKKFASEINVFMKKEMGNRISDVITKRLQEAMPERVDYEMKQRGHDQLSKRKYELKAQQIHEEIEGRVKKQITEQVKAEMAEKGYKGEITFDDWEFICTQLNEFDLDSVAMIVKSKSILARLARKGYFISLKDPSPWLILYELKMNKAAARSIIKIDLQKLELEKFPHPFRVVQLPKVLQLFIGLNRFHSIPAEAPFMMPNITTLSAPGNCIEAYPFNLHLFASLTQLKLGNNAISEIPDELGVTDEGEPRNLEIDLSNNRIEDIDLEALEEDYNSDLLKIEIDITGNKVTEKPPFSEAGDGTLEVGQSVTLRFG